MEQPTVSLRIGDSHFAFSQKGEVLETVEVVDSGKPESIGKPDWNEAGICDPRGTGGEESFEAIRKSLVYGESAAIASGHTEGQRVPDAEEES